MYGKLCRSTLQSRLQHIYHGQPYARADLNPTPKSTISPRKGLCIVLRAIVLISSITEYADNSQYSFFVLSVHFTYILYYLYPDSHR
jgi:hypothetical protein